MEEILNHEWVAVGLFLWLVYQAFYKMPSDMQTHWESQREIRETKKGY